LILPNILDQMTVSVLAEDVFRTLGDKQSVSILNAAHTGFHPTNGISNQSKKQIT
jgi:hypothetical protein